MTPLPRRGAIAVFLAFAFTYFFSALVRAITATLAPMLTREFALSAQELGLLAGGFFFGFAATQLPLGRWLDRHGPKQVILGFLTLAVAGFIMFIVTFRYAAYVTTLQMSFSQASWLRALSKSPFFPVQRPA